MEAPILIQIDANQNCDAIDGLVFQPKAAAREVKRVRVSRNGAPVWCAIEAVEEGGAMRAAMASPIDD